MIPFIIILSIAALLVFRGLYEVRHYKISKCEIEGKTKAKFVLISDMHACTYGRKPVNGGLVLDIRKENPDFIILAGDMYTATKKEKNLDETDEFIRELCKIAPVYYGVGNHEDMIERNHNYSVTKSHLDKIKETKNLYYLSDESASFNDEITILGLNLEHVVYKEKPADLKDNYLTQKLGELNKDKYNILIAHNPKYAKAYAKYGADLTLCGHVHGGIVRLPFLGGLISTDFKPFPRYTKGLYKVFDKNVYVTSGLGSHHINYRLFNKPEVVSIEII